MKITILLYLWKIKKICRYIKGEFYCRYYHKPLMVSTSGYGGTDVFGRRRKSYYSRACIECDNSWESNRESKPLTKEQEKACAQVLGNMWKGDK